MIIPEGKLGRTVVAYLDKIETLAAASGQKVRSIKVDYVELGEFAGEHPYPKIEVTFYTPALERSDK